MCQTRLDEPDPLVHREPCFTGQMKEEHGWRHVGRRGHLANGFQGGVVRFIAQVSTRIGGDGIRHGEGCRVPQREVQPATALTQAVEVHVVHLTAQVIGDPHVQTVPSDSLQPRSITGFTQTNMKNSIPAAPPEDAERFAVHRGHQRATHQLRHGRERSHPTTG